MCIVSSQCFEKWKDSNCIISYLVNNISKSRKYTWTKESRTAKMIEKDCPESCLCCYRKKSNLRLEHWFSKYYLFSEFRKK